MELFLLYLILKLNGIHQTMEAIIVIGVVCVFLVGFGLVISTVEHLEEITIKSWKRWFIGLTVGLVLLAGIKTLLPTTKEASILVGAWVVKEVVTSETAKRIASNSVKAIEDWLAALHKVPDK